MLPREPLRVDDPILVALRIATGSLVLFENPGSGGTARPFAQFRQFRSLLGLKAQMVYAGLWPRDEIAKLTHGSPSIHLA